MAMVFKRGDTWTAEFFYEDSARNPIDLTGCVARLQVRDRAIGRLLIDVDADSGLVLDGPAGKLFLRVEADETKSLIPGRHNLDIQLTFPDGTVQSTETFLVTVEEAITRDIS